MSTPAGPTASELLCRRPELRYLSPDDFARLDYGRLLWRNHRQRLSTHWLDERHPGRERFLAHRGVIARLLECPLDELDVAAAPLGGLRAAIREIPPVFGFFWKASESLGR